MREAFLPQMNTDLHGFKTAGKQREFSGVSFQCSEGEPFAESTVALASSPCEEKREAFFIGRLRRELSRTIYTDERRFQTAGRQRKSAFRKSIIGFNYPASNSCSKARTRTDADLRTIRSYLGFSLICGSLRKSAVKPLLLE